MNVPVSSGSNREDMVRGPGAKELSVPLRPSYCARWMRVKRRQYGTVVVQQTITK